MHKTDLVNKISGISGLSKKDSSAALEAVVQSITDALKSGDQVSIIGFGSFKVNKIKARKGRNPQTGAEIQIPASNRVKFTSGKALKSSVN